MASLLAFLGLVATPAEAADRAWSRLAATVPADLRWTDKAHAGACLLDDSLLVFGSDTHGKGWDNAVYGLDLRSGLWRRYYQPDPSSDYVVRRGVLTTLAGRPPAQHVYGALVCDHLRQRMLVLSHPGHLLDYAPALRDAGAYRWPVWSFEPAVGRWTALRGPTGPGGVFASFAVLDPQRQVAVAVCADRRCRGTWEYDLTRHSWRHTDQTPIGIHGNAVYDVRHRVILLHGAKNQRHVMAYREGAWRDQGAAWPSPPTDQHVPLAYHEASGTMLALVDEQDRGLAAIWAYHYATNAWTRPDWPSLPFATGMNYAMALDEGEQRLVVVVERLGQPDVWQLHLTSADNPSSGRP